MAEVENHIIDEVDDLPYMGRSTRQCFGDATEELREGSGLPKESSEVRRGFCKDTNRKKKVREFQ